MEIFKPPRIYGNLEIDNKKITVSKEGYSTVEGGETLFILEVRVVTNELLPTNKIFKVDKISGDFIGVAVLSEISNLSTDADYNLSDFIIVKKKSLLEISQLWSGISTDINNLANEAKEHYQLFSDVVSMEYPLKVIENTGVDAVYNDYLIVKKEWEALKTERDIKQREYNEINTQLETWKGGVMSIIESAASSVASKTASLGQFLGEMNSLAMGAALLNIKNNNETAIVHTKAAKEAASTLNDKLVIWENKTFTQKAVDNSNQALILLEKNKSIMDESFVQNGNSVTMKNIEIAVNEMSSFFSFISDINTKIVTIKSLVEGFLSQMTQRRNVLVGELEVLNRKIDIARKNKDEIVKQILELDPNFDISKL